MNSNLNISSDERISKILNAIMGVSAGNYQTGLIPSEKDDEIDAIMVGMNMLAEEIRATRDSLEELLKKGTEKLTESEIKFSVLADSASEQIFIINKDFLLVYVNESAAKTFQAPSDYLVGKSIDELFPPEDLGILKLPINNVFSSGITQNDEREIKFPHNSLWHNTSFTLIYSPERSQIISVLGISRDITDHKLAEMKLQEKVVELFPRRTDMAEAKTYTAKLYEGKCFED